MTRRGSRISFTMLALAGVGFHLGAAEAGVEVVRQYFGAGGAVQSSGGGYELNGTIGQSVVGVSASKSFTLTTGLWPALSAGDCNLDGTVGIIDYESLAICLSGPGSGSASASCRCFDLDASNQVDLRDFALYASGFTGP